MTVPAPSSGTPTLLRAAFVRRVHGVRGDVKVESLGGDARRFAAGTVLVSERGGRRLTVRSARALDGDDLLLRFEELATREEAAALSGDYLCVSADHARSLGGDEWFVWQLVGLRVRSAEGVLLGTVSDVEAHPASDVLVVSNASGEERYPLVRQWVESVDVTAGEIVLTPWPLEDA
ncbi:MAG: ribosome maturation factor RimM [Candidatus Dormibacteria bacterium]